MFFLTNKLKWEDLTRFNFFYPPFKYNVGRCLYVEKKYDEYKTYLDSNGININDQIKRTYILGIDSRIDSGFNSGFDVDISVRHEIICRGIIDKKGIDSKGIKYTLAKNSFPYYCDDNIVHILLWLEEMIDYESIKNIILDKLFDGNLKLMEEKCVFFRNREELISIDNVPHIHIFIKDWLD